MNFGKINPCDIANGPGCRVSLFVSGCRNHCKGCFQPETWSFDYGDPFTEETVDEILELLSRPYIDGLTILGGDPMEPENLPAVEDLVRLVKSEFPEKSIWLYTGYKYEDLDPWILLFLDVLVDGPYVDELRDPSLAFRGSSNQRIIDVKKSRAEGRIVLRPDPDRKMKPVFMGG